MPTTKQAGKSHRTPDGKFPPGVSGNPSGKGGFQERPQDRSDGRWDKEGSISYQYQKLMRLSPAELNAYEPETVAQDIARARLLAARDSRVGLGDTKEISDRTEGKAPQSIDVTSGGEAIAPIIRIIDERPRDTDTQ